MKEESIKKALVIQGDVVLLKILEYLLLSLKYHVKAVDSFTELSLEDQYADYSVVVTDILFDAVSPLEFVLNLQESISCKNIIIVTNMRQEKIKKNIISIPDIKGFHGIPFDLEILEKQLINI